MSGKNSCFEIESTLQYFSDVLLRSMIEWAEKNNYQYAWILHDKDIKHNDETNEDEKVKEHRHLLINTGTSKWNKKMLVDRFACYGLTENMYQHVRKGWFNALSYLVHRTDNAVKEGKHLYELSEVHSNFDYEQTIKLIENQVEEKRTIVDDVIKKIDSLECRRFNVTQYITVEDYSKKGNKDRINAAFTYVETRLLEESKERNMEVYWIFGEPGIGKTTLSKVICREQKWSYAISSSSNDPLQDYNGQDCLILDDFRPAGWSKSDVLKMFDNNTSSSVKSRYQNKHTCYLRAIIVTSVRSPYDLWLQWDNGGSLEPYEQLQRRITSLIEMKKENTEGDFARVYFTVNNMDIFDFSDELERIRLEAEKRAKNSPFAKMKRLGSCVSSVSVDKVKKEAELNDVPF